MNHKNQAMNVPKLNHEACTSGSQGGQAGLGDYPSKTWRSWEKESALQNVSPVTQHSHKNITELEATILSEQSPL